MFSRLFSVKLATGGSVLRISTRLATSAMSTITVMPTLTIALILLVFLSDYDSMNNTTHKEKITFLNW